MAGLSKGAMLSVLGGIIALVSAFLPWYSFEMLGVSTTFKPWGTNTAYVLIVLAVLGLFFAWKGSAKSSKGMYIGALLMGLFLVLVVWANAPSNAPFEGVKALYGYWTSFVSGWMIFVGGIMGLVMKKK